MPTKVTLVLSFFSVILFSEVSAQNVYFTGVGRALVANDGLTDNTNTASKLKASGGYTLFDLGINAKASDVLRASVILRVRNEFGGFFSDGASLQFRQMQLEGLIAKKVKYDIGDIYLKQTRYTFWSEDNITNKYEADIFSLKRNIVNYENFYIGNNWRMQAMNAKTKLNFKKGAESLEIRAYGGRTLATNLTTTPDRFIYGGTLNLTQSKYLRIAGNVAAIGDMKTTATAPSVIYNNRVYTVDFEIAPIDNDNFKLALEGEVGASNFSLERTSDSTKNKFSGSFYDVGLKGNLKKIGLTLGGSYRNVDYNFNSPLAQTRRLLAPAPGGSLPLHEMGTMNNGVTNRPVSLFDMYSQETGLYNQSISPTLMNYYVQYTMAEPYGRATPNRKGITIEAELAPESKLYSLSGDINLLSENVSEGDSVTFAKRKFMLIRAGGVFNIHKLIDFEKVIAINGGIRTESSNRGGTNPVDLSSSTIDLGLDVEVLKDLHLLGGAKLFQVKGNEVQGTRDAYLNNIIAFTEQKFDQKQTIIAAGLRYDYGTTGYFSMHYHMVNYKDNLVDANTYKLNQLFLVFGLKF